MDTIRMKLNHPWSPDRRGEYVFEDGRAAYFFDKISGPDDPKLLQHILYAASKYGCRVTGPGIDADIQTL